MRPDASEKQFQDNRLDWRGLSDAVRSLINLNYEKFQRHWLQTDTNVVAANSMHQTAGDLVLNPVIVVGSHTSSGIDPFFVQYVLDRSGTPSDYADEYDQMEFYQCMSEYYASDEPDVDAGAVELGEQILAKEDWKSREYAGVVYKTETGEIKISTLSQGQTVAEAVSDGLGAPQTEIPIPTDAAEVLGIVHNHPDVGYNHSSDLDNRNPSSGDWAAFHYLVDNNLADINILAHYIIDYDGNMHEFDAGDKPYHNADDNPASPGGDNNVYWTGCD